MGRLKEKDMVYDIKLSAGDITRRSGITTVPEYTISRFEEVKPITKYYVSCKAKCDFQQFGFCTCVTGRCFAEESDDLIAGLDSRVIIDMEV